MTYNNFEQRILDYPDVYDPEDVHHEFKDGGHGRKVDLESIDTNSGLYSELVIASGRKIVELCDGTPDVLIGIANGGNHWARDIAEEIGPDVLALETHKTKRGSTLEYGARLMLRNIRPDCVVIVDDLGTTGRSCVPVAKQLQHNGIRSMHRLNTLKAFFIATRNSRLRFLERRNIAFESLAQLHIPTYKNADACKEDSDGFCARGVQLIPHGR